MLVDPAEGHDLAKTHPDIVEMLDAKMKAWLAGLPQEYHKGEKNKERKKKRKKK